MLLAPPGHVASHHRLLSFESAQFLLALSEQSEQRASCSRRLHLASGPSLSARSQVHGALPQPVQLLPGEAAARGGERQAARPELPGPGELPRPVG